MRRRSLKARQRAQLPFELLLAFRHQLAKQALEGPAINQGEIDDLVEGRPGFAVLQIGDNRLVALEKVGHITLGIPCLAPRCAQIEGELCAHMRVIKLLEGQSNRPRATGVAVGL